MAVSYKKLWKLLIDRDMRKKDLCAAAGISHASMAKLGDLMLAVTDTAIAAQNAVVAAESFGIGSCYIGDIMEITDSSNN